MQTGWKWTSLAPLVISAAFAVGLPTAVLAQENSAITIVLPNEPDQLEPCETSYAAVGQVLKENVIETLLDINPANGELSPRLATSWEQVNDTTWRFHLVKNATFTDGAPFNAEAVVFNIQRAMNPAMQCSAITKAFSGFVLTASAVDDYTVEVVADRPAPILPVGFSVLPMASPNTPPAEPTRDPIGTGPYVLSDWQPGIQIVLERQDGYWGAKPKVSKVTFVFRTESAVRAAMVATGEADIALAISEQDATDPATDFPYLNSETTWIRIDERFAPFNDVRVRQALNYAIDRKAMLGTVTNGDSLIATQLPGPSINGHNPDIVPYSYDPEKAKALLAEVAADGVKIDTPVRFIARIEQWDNVGEMAQVLTQMFNRVGFKVTLEMMERAREIEYQSKPYPEDVGPNLILISSDNNTGDAATSAFGNYHSEGQQSTTLSTKVDAMIAEASTSTGEERTTKYRELFRYLHDDLAASAPLFYMVGVTRVSKRLDWKPTIASNSQIEVQNIKFAE